MTFDPSLRLKDTLAVSDAPAGDEVRVPFDSGPGGGILDASLLDARHTFDSLVRRYAPDEAARERILANRFYGHLAGNLSGVLEYMAVERLFEVASSGRYGQIILDTPPTRQALDFLEAPRRIVDFLDSGALKIAMKEWFDSDGRFQPGQSSSGLVRLLGRSLEGLLDRVVGLQFLRDMLEFFQAFTPLYAGFRERALEVEKLLASDRTLFSLVSGPGPERIPDTLFFARKLDEAGLSLGPILVNRVHPQVVMKERLPELPDTSGNGPCAVSGTDLYQFLGERDARGVDDLRGLVDGRHPVVEIPLQGDEPTDLESLESLGAEVLAALRQDGSGG
jgi:anion-transporting  ArsA/GET3 family ATPase